MASDVVQQALEQAGTWAEARRLLREALPREGWAPDDTLLDEMLRAGCGGDAVEVGEDGLPVHPMARKFYTGGGSHGR